MRTSKELTTPSSLWLPKGMLLTTMTIWGTLGVLQHYIPLHAVLLVTLRTSLAVLFLCGVLLVLRRQFDWAGVKRNLGLLIGSGTVICLNWTLLFQAFKHTTVAVAVLCYCMAPVLVMIFSPWLLKERLNARKVVGILAAFTGIGFVSGVFTGAAAEGVTLEGVLFGLGSAVFYASTVFFNKRMQPVEATSKTIVQLAVATLWLIPYSLLLPWPEASIFTPTVIILILLLGCVHTGLACALYFGSMARLPAQTVALYSYWDPILGVLLSVLVLHEPMTLGMVIGAILVLGGAFIGEYQAHHE